MIRRRRFALMLTAAIVAATTVTVAGSSAAPRPLASLLVRSSQVGPDYRAHREAWGKSTSAQSFRCHHIRDRDRAVEAIGDEYAKKDARPQLFNVLFRYRTSTQTAGNLAFLRHILTACPKLTIVVKGPETKITLTVSLTPIPTPHGLLPRSVVVRQTNTETGARPRRSIDIYQPDETILSLTYAFGSNLPKLRALATHVAQASASNLG
jgi:hypothetical protein